MIAPRIQKIVESYRGIARGMNQEKLRLPEGGDFALDFSDVFSQLEDNRGPSLLLGIFSPKGIMYLLKEYGILYRLETLGYDRLEIRLDLKDTYRQVVRLFGIGQDHPEHLLLEIVLREDRFSVKKYLPKIPPEHIRKDPLNVVVIDWLQMQYPKAPFTRERPMLPGQDYPGLGLGAEVMALLVILAERMHKDAILATPQQFYNAYMYRQAFQFLYPKHEGRFQAILRDTSDWGLAETSWGIEKSFLIDTRTGRPFAWRGSPMVLPITAPAQEYFRCPQYHRLAEQAMKSEEFIATWLEGQFQELLPAR